MSDSAVVLQFTPRGTPVVPRPGLQQTFTSEDAAPVYLGFPGLQYSWHRYSIIIADMPASPPMTPFETTFSINPPRTFLPSETLWTAITATEPKHRIIAPPKGRRNDTDDSHNADFISVDNAVAKASIGVTLFVLLAKCSVALGGPTILHPLIADMLLVASLSFLVMSRVR